MVLTLLPKAGYHFLKLLILIVGVLLCDFACMSHEHCRHPHAIHLMATKELYLHF